MSASEGRQHNRPLFCSSKHPGRQYMSGRELPWWLPLYITECQFSKYPFFFEPQGVTPLSHRWLWVLSSLTLSLVSCFHLCNTHSHSAAFLFKAWVAIMWIKGQELENFLLCLLRVAVDTLQLLVAFSSSWWCHSWILFCIFDDAREVSKDVCQSN